MDLRHRLCEWIGYKTTAKLPIALALAACLSTNAMGLGGTVWIEDPPSEKHRSKVAELLKRVRPADSE